MAAQFQNSRLLRDAALTITNALPNNTTSYTTNYLDIGAGPFNPEEIEVEIQVPAIAAHTTTNNLTIQLITSATIQATSSFAATNPTVIMNVVGVGSSGSVATTVRFKLPPGTLRYIAFAMIATTDDCSAVTITASILV